MYTFQNKWAGILSQKHGKPFMSWQKRLQNDEVHECKFYLLHTVEYSFLSFTNEICFFRMNYHYSFFLYFENEFRFFLLLK